MRNAMLLTKPRMAAALLALAVLATAARLLARSSLGDEPPTVGIHPQAAQHAHRSTLVAATGLPAPDPKEAPAAKQSGDDPVAPPQRVTAFARRLSGIMDLVLRNHIKPPHLTSMILSGTREMLVAGRVAEPDDMVLRIAGIETEEDFVKFLPKIWPVPAGPEATPAEKLEAAMLGGLLKTVAGNPEILPADAVKVVKQLGGNRYVGIGISIGFDNKEKLPQIMNPFMRGPARKAGAKAGDLIVKVDGKSTEGLEPSSGVEKIVAWIRGEEGTTVTLVVRQPGSSERRTLRIIRGIVPIDTVLGYRRTDTETWTYRVSPSDPIGYVWVKTINSSTLHELRKVERRLRSEGVRALVLDFRFRGGDEILHHAELVADGLLDGGVTWRLHDAQKRVHEVTADRECLFRECPMVVLVNGGQPAIAGHVVRRGAERSKGPIAIESNVDQPRGAVAAALQDNGRAILVGEPAKVNPYVNSLIDLPDGQGAIQLRTALLERTAVGRGWSLQPDHVVALDEAQEKAILKWLIAKEITDLPAGADDQPPADPQLEKALELLRAQLHAAGPVEQP